MPVFTEIRGPEPDRNHVDGRPRGDRQLPCEPCCGEDFMHNSPANSQKE
jgi:hypothetical protein